MALCNIRNNKILGTSASLLVTSALLLVVTMFAIRFKQDGAHEPECKHDREAIYICPNDTLVGHSCRTLLWDTLVGNSCGSLL